MEKQREDCHLLEQWFTGLRGACPGRRNAEVLQEVLNLLPSRLRRQVALPRWSAHAKASACATATTGGMLVGEESKQRSREPLSRTASDRSPFCTVYAKFWTCDPSELDTLQPIGINKLPHSFVTKMRLAEDCDMSVGDRKQRLEVRFGSHTQTVSILCKVYKGEEYDLCSSHASSSC